MESLSAADLLARARSGEPDALDQLFDRVSGKLLALIRIRMGALRERMESRDLLQGTLTKALGSLDQFAGRDSAALMAWLGAIARNEIRDQLDRQHAGRRRRDLEVAIDDAPELEASVASMVSRLAVDERLRRLESALLELPEDQREVVVLRSFEELEFRAVGERMGRSADACRMLYARALAALTMRLTAARIAGAGIAGDENGVVTT